MSKRVETFGFLSKLLNNSKKQKISLSTALPLWNEIYRPTPKLLVENFFNYFFFEINFIFPISR